jgi:2-oxoglutarate ferredoxin oxidoreductase subunit alpha
MNDSAGGTREKENGGGSAKVLIDGSMLIIESLSRAGADVFIGYPITPANLLYQYGAKRFPTALAAPDEITTAQWMSGFAAVGRIPVTATSFPGFALMVESVNMAVMMELPMVIVLAQRLGPATGTATLGAQGDILLLQGTVSGGYPLPTLCISAMDDCWTLSAEAVRMAVRLRTPVVLLTSKEDVMTLRSFDTSSLPEIDAATPKLFSGDGPYESYRPDKDLVPPFLPVGNPRHQVRLNASTHDSRGILQNSTPEALANTTRLQAKLETDVSSFTFFELDEQEGSEVLVVSYGITSQAAREAVKAIRAEGSKVSLFVPKTIFPVPPSYFDILCRYERVVVAEENLTGQLRHVLFGGVPRPYVTGINAIGKIITPGEIVEGVMGRV